MKVAVWTLYWLSLAGFAVAALLGNSRTRTLIVDLWLQSYLHGLRVTDEQRVQLQQRFLSAYCLNERGTLSAKKLLLLAALATLLSTAGALRFIPLNPLALAIAAAPAYGWHLIWDGAFACSCIWIFRHTPKPSYVLPRLCLAWLLTFGTGVYALLVLNSFVSTRSPLHIYLSFAGPSMILDPVMLKLVAAAPFRVSVMAAYVPIAFAMVMSGLLIVGVALTASLMHSPLLHRALQTLCIWLNRTTPMQLISASTLAFTLATGMMQAYTF